MKSIIQRMKHDKVKGNKAKHEGAERLTKEKSVTGNKTKY